jgi:hypothetical protein
MATEYHLRIIAALLLILCLSGPGFAVQSKKRAAASKKGHHSALARRRQAAKPKSLAQTAPSPERYQEIQQALMSKGYGPQAPNGVWNAGWASELKRYQQDQKLEATGKLNSMSLITLGLGPKRPQPAGAAAPAPPQPIGATAPLPRTNLQVQAQPVREPK